MSVRCSLMSLCVQWKWWLREHNLLVMDLEGLLGDGPHKLKRKFKFLRKVYLFLINLFTYYLISHHLIYYNILLLNFAPLKSMFWIHPSLQSSRPFHTYTLESPWGMRSLESDIGCSQLDGTKHLKEKGQNYNESTQIKFQLFFTLKIL